MSCQVYYLYGIVISLEALGILFVFLKGCVTAILECGNPPPHLLLSFIFLHPWCHVHSFPPPPLLLTSIRSLPLRFDVDSASEGAFLMVCTWHGQ